MYIPKRVLDPIINRARALFPVNEYGRAGMLTHPGARICPVALGKDTDIMLVSNTPRSLRNGRYYPGWNCLESSCWLERQIRKEVGRGSEIVMLKTPLYDIDVAVLSEDTLVSITPGVSAFQDIHPFKSHHKIFDHVGVWKLCTKPNISLTDHMILGWEDLGDFSFLNSCGLEIKNGNILRALTMSLCVSGEKLLCEGRVSFDARFADLDTIRQAFISDDAQNGFQNFRTNNWVECYDVPENTAEVQALAIGRASALSRDVIPKMFRILDTDWFNRQAG